MDTGPHWPIAIRPSPSWRPSCSSTSLFPSSPADSPGSRAIWRWREYFIARSGDGSSRSHRLVKSCEAALRFARREQADGLTRAARQHRERHRGGASADRARRSRGTAHGPGRGDPEGCTASTQVLANELRDDAEGKPLEDLLRDVSDDFLSDLEVRFQSEGLPRPLTSAVTREARSIVVESLNNARKHARAATRVDVALHWGIDGFVLEIHDDGAPGTPKSRPGGLGLRGLDERARAVGGSLATDFTDGGRVRFELPYRYPPGEPSSASDERLGRRRSPSVSRGPERTAQHPRWHRRRRRCRR